MTLSGHLVCFVFGESKEKRGKIRKAFFLFVTFGLVGLMCGSASGQQAKNIIKLKRAITVKDASYKMQKHFFLRRGELRLLIEGDPKVL